MRLPIGMGREFCADYVSLRSCQETRPALNAGERRRVWRSRGEGLKISRKERVGGNQKLVFHFCQGKSSQKTTAGEMTDTAILAGRILLIVLVRRMVVARGKLVVMTGSRKLQRRILFQFHTSQMAIAARGLHGNRGSQRAAAEHRQPNDQHHCNEFSEWKNHEIQSDKILRCRQMDP